MFLALFTIVLGTLLIGSLVTPAMYVGLLSSFSNFPWPYSRVFDRVAMVLVLVLCLVFRKQFSVKRAIDALRSIKLSIGLNHWIIGFFISFIPTLLALLLIVNGIDIAWHSSPWELFISRVHKILLAAIIIGIIEEGFFRVILLDSIREKFSLFTAMLITSILYGVVHFISPVKSWSFQELSWFTGFDYLIQIFSRFSSLGVVCGIFGLFLIGIVLSYSIVKSRSVYFAMGLHAGWIFIAKLAHYCTELTPTTHVAAAVGRRYYLVSLPLSWMVIGFVGVIAYLVAAKLSKRSEGA